MAKDRFDLEQDIMNCWSVVDDLKMLLESDGYDNDDIKAVIRLYQKKFEVMWATFEDCIRSNFEFKPKQVESIKTYGIDDVSDVGLD